MVIGIGLSACNVPDEPPRNCIDNGEPFLTIGTGEQTYEELIGDPPDLELVHGPQGGYHLVLGFQTKNVDVIHFVTTTMQGIIDGEIRASNTRITSFKCDTNTQLSEAYNAYLIYDAEPDELAGQLTTIDVHIEDIDGRTASSSRVIRIVDTIDE